MTAEILIAVDGVSLAPVKRFVRNKNEPIQKAIMRERMISARIMNGMTAVEAAERLGYRNSTQLSQIESGDRKVPNDWQLLLTMSQVYSVSMDYLVGISPNPERDALASEHFAIMRGFEQLQKVQAATMATAFIKYASTGGPTLIDIESVCNSVEKVIDAVKTMRERCSEFDDLRGGATVLASIEMLGEAIKPVKGTLCRRKANEQYFIDLSAGKCGPLAYLVNEQEDSDLVEQ